MADPLDNLPDLAPVSGPEPPSEPADAAIEPEPILAAEPFVWPEPMAHPFEKPTQRPGRS